MSSTEDYAHRGVRALVALHERELRAFLDTWKRAREANVNLPETGDPAYASLDALLGHVLRAARGYVVWTCEKLGEPDPGIDPAPDATELAGRADEYLEHVLAGWRRPLRELTEKHADREMYESSWGTPYCIDAMLEHAVMHPVRHAYQLEELMAAQGG